MQAMKRFSVAVAVALSLLALAPGRGSAPGEDEGTIKLTKCLLDLERDEAPVEARREAVGRLSYLAGRLVQIVNDLARALGDPDEEVRLKAAATLTNLGPSAEFALPSLIAALRQDSSEEVRAQAALALAAVCGRLRPLLRPPDPLKEQAVSALTDAVL